MGRHAQSVIDGDWIRSADWSCAKTPIIELSGKVLGIIGFGRIGQQTANIARAFGMQVIYYDRLNKRAADNAVSNVTGSGHTGTAQRDARTVWRIADTASVCDLHIFLEFLMNGHFFSCGNDKGMGAGAHSMPSRISVCAATYNIPDIGRLLSTLGDPHAKDLATSCQ